MTPPPSLGGHRPALGLLARIALGEERYAPCDHGQAALAEHAALVSVLERLAAWRLIFLTPDPVGMPGRDPFGISAELTDRGRLYATLLPVVNVLTDPEGRRWAYWEEDPRTDAATAGDRIIVFCAGAMVRTTRGPAGVTRQPDAVVDLWGRVA